MKKSAGFTLIELVIVIVILGILGAVAAPRFINMQGDAYEANVKALNGSIQSAMTLANTKAILNGFDKKTGNHIVNTSDFKTVAEAEADDTTVTFANGFPVATKQGIIAMLQDSNSFASAGTQNNTASNESYTFRPGTGSNVLDIYPSARFANETCKVIYTQATAVKPATVKAITNGC